MQFLYLLLFKATKVRWVAQQEINQNLFKAQNLTNNSSRLPLRERGLLLTKKARHISVLVTNLPLRKCRGLMFQELSKLRNNQKCINHKL